VAILRRILFVLAAMAAVLVLPRDGAAAQPLSAYEVKAGFLVNFAKFTTWPPDTFAGDAAPILIAVVGEDPFGSAIDHAVHGQKAGERPIVVKRVGSRDDLSAYQIVFIASSEQKQLDQILHRLEGSATLPVSDIAGFSQAGGAIELVMDGSRVRFEVNVGNSDHRRVKVSTRLVALATKVHSGDK
jgi:hypothetical protein